MSKGCRPPNYVIIEQSQITTAGESLILRRVYLQAYQKSFEYLWLVGIALIALGIVFLYLKLEGALTAAFLCLGVLLMAYSVIKRQWIKPLNEKSTALEIETKERLKVEEKVKQVEQQLRAYYRPGFTGNYDHPAGQDPLCKRCFLQDGGLSPGRAPATLYPTISISHPSR